MAPASQLLVEGTYLYYQQNVNYAQENFKLVQLAESQNYHIYAEVLSRLETGEFLKILVRYEMNQLFHPTMVKVEKFLGNRYAVEEFHHDHLTQELNYTFNNTHETREFNRGLSAKHFITSPAFSTSAIFTQSKKFDPTGRTAFVFIGGSNDWEYESPPEDRTVFAEYVSREVENFRINNNELSASQLNIYEHDSAQPGPEKPVEMYLSKHFNIPYQMIHGDQKIVIKNLIRN
jgi:hypothetical protein